VCSIMFFLNLFIWAKGSSQAIPFGTMFAIFAMWVFISVPLCYAGAFFGFRKEAITLPVRTNPLPRHIPPQPWYLSAVLSTFIGGVLPFGAVFIELYFVMSSIWLHQVGAVLCGLCVCVCFCVCVLPRYLPAFQFTMASGDSPLWLQTYVLFGFLMLAFVIVLITCAEIAVVLTYLQLCAEDWKWCWRAVFAPGSSALYLFLYSILYYYMKVRGAFTP